MNRDLCLDLGLRMRSHYFHYGIIIKWFYWILLEYCYIAVHKWEDCLSYCCCHDALPVNRNDKATNLKTIMAAERTAKFLN